MSTYDLAEDLGTDDLTTVPDADLALKFEVLCSINPDHVKDDERLWCLRLAHASVRAEVTRRAINRAEGRGWTIPYPFPPYSDERLAFIAFD